MKRVTSEIQRHGKRLKDLILENNLPQKGFSLIQYQKYLQMQYHLTNGVQRHFFAMAANYNFHNKKSFRNFLIKFAIEEENHFLLAQKDLHNTGGEIGPIPLDVKLWWSYFDTIVDTSPMIRLGATCVLENIASFAKDEIKATMQNTPFLNAKNTSFIVIHQHEELPHGDEIISALNHYGPSEKELQELHQGAIEGGTIFLRLIEGALNPTA